MSLPNSSAQDAISGDKNNDCVRAGEAVLTLLENLLFILTESVLLVLLHNKSD
jgi:hypothetical protein